MTAEQRSFALANGIAREFERRLVGEHLPRLRRCVELLGDERLWQRAGPTGNSVGNLLLHLAGNTTQWILAAFGELPDERARSAEFAADGGRSGTELMAQLDDVYRRAAKVVARLTPEALLAERRIQGFDETGLSAVLHVLEHCSGHAYQVYAWTKQVTGVDLRFYDL